jgi:diacylglycerol kinase family enzyme
MRAALIVNPSASGVTPELVAAVERELRTAGPLQTALTERSRHATELAEQVAPGADRLYVFSGDGVYNEVVNGLAGSTPVGFVPGGRTSVLSRALGLPRDPVDCARALARSERTRKISLGRVNGRRFTFSAGLGLDAELVREVDRLGRSDGRRAGDIAATLAFLRLVGDRAGRFREAMTVLGRGRVAFALVANCDPYTYLGRVPLHVAPEARFELGLDLVAPRRLHAVSWMRAGFWLLVGRSRPGWLVHVHDADEIRIECDGPTPLQVDGEDLGDVTDAHFEAERGALDVLVG